jgi:stress response protein YsnF
LAYEGRDEHPLADEGSGLENELRVQRSEEALSTGVRQREAGSMNVKKSVRTEREEVRVPRRREEVEVERIPTNQEVDLRKEEVEIDDQTTRREG